MKNIRKLFVGILLAVLLVFVGVGGVMAATRGGPFESHGGHLPGRLAGIHDIWGVNSLEKLELPDLLDEALLKQQMAENLGVGVEELEAAMKGGKASLVTLGVDSASLRAALHQGMEQQIGEAVTAGAITQGEANDLLTGQNHLDRHSRFPFVFDSSSKGDSSP